MAGFARLDNHDRINSLFVLFLLHVTLQFRHLMWNDPSLRIESEVYRILVLHLFQALSKVAFFGHTIHSWEVIHFLESLQLAELFSRNCNIVPNDVHICMSVSFITTLLLCL